MYTKKQLDCDQCDYIGKTLSYLRIHQGKVHGGVLFLCDECDFSGTNAEDLNKHTIHHRRIRFKCDICEFGTGSTRRLEKHKDLHRYFVEDESDEENDDIQLKDRETDLNFYLPSLIEQEDDKNDHLHIDCDCEEHEEEMKKHPVNIRLALEENAGDKNAEKSAKPTEQNFEKWIKHHFETPKSEYRLFKNSRHIRIFDPFNKHRRRKNKGCSETDEPPMKRTRYHSRPDDIDKPESLDVELPKLDPEEYNLSPEVDISAEEMEMSTPDKEISTPEKELSSQENYISIQENEICTRERKTPSSEKETLTSEKEPSTSEKAIFVPETRLITKIDESILKSMKRPGYRSVKVDELDKFNENEKDSPQLEEENLFSTLSEGDQLTHVAPSILAETVFIKTEEIENKPDVYSPDGSGTPDEQRPTDICQEYIDTNSEQLTPKVEKDDDFPCALLGEVNSSHQKLKEHVKIIFTCEFCKFAAADSSSLLEHKRRSHSIKCSLCNYTATYLGSLYKHRNKNHGLIECEQCFIALPSNEELLIHIKQAHAYLFKCDKCPYETKLGSYLKTHIKHKHNTSTFKCELCDYSCMAETGIKAHMQIHRVFSYKCTICSYTCATLKRLSGHETRHHPEVTFRCDICDYVDSSSVFINIHKKNTHEEKKKPKLDNSNFRYPCTECEYAGVSDEDLIKHKLVKHDCETFN